MHNLFRGAFRWYSFLGINFYSMKHLYYLRDKGEMVRHVIKYSLWAMASGLSGWSRIWKEHDWEIGYKEIWGRGMWMYTLNGKKKMQLFVSYVNDH